MKDLDTAFAESPWVVVVHDRSDAGVHGPFNDYAAAAAWAAQYGDNATTCLMTAPELITAHRQERAEDAAWARMH